MKTKKSFNKGARQSTDSRDDQNNYSATSTKWSNVPTKI